MDISDEEIKRILEIHQKRLAYDRKRYHEKLKHDPEFIRKNRARANEHYKNHGQKKRDKYQAHKELMNAKASYRYYLKTKRIELFKEKHAEKYKLLLDTNDPILNLPVPQE